MTGLFMSCIDMRVFHFRLIDFTHTDHQLSAPKWCTVILVPSQTYSMPPWDADPGSLKSLRSHESWNFPAGVSFALKQNMYWGGFCAFLPDISYQALGGGGGGVSCF